MFLLYHAVDVSSCYDVLVMLMEVTVYPLMMLCLLMLLSGYRSLKSLFFSIVNSYIKSSYYLCIKLKEESFSMMDLHQTACAKIS